MIRKDKYLSALYSLQALFVAIRYDAYQKVDIMKIAEIVDAAHNLPMYIAHENDYTDRFQDELEWIAKHYPDYRRPLVVFLGD